MHIDRYYATTDYTYLRLLDSGAIASLHLSKQGAIEESRRYGADAEFYASYEEACRYRAWGAPIARREEKTKLDTLQKRHNAILAKVEAAFARIETLLHRMEDKEDPASIALSDELHRALVQAAIDGKKACHIGRRIAVAELQA